MKRYFFSLAIVLAAAGCSKHSTDEQQTAFPMPAGLAGVYAGSFPCGNCASIAATLWLRDDARFFLRQSIVAEGGATDSSSYSFGRWSWDESSAEIVLSARGPERRLTQLDAQRLRLRMPSPVEHVLERDAAAPPFADRVQLEGETTVADKGGPATFIQCVTGLELPIADAGALRELRRQHRVLNPSHKVALTTVEGQITSVVAGDSMREVLVVDRVVEPIKPGKGC